MPTILIVDAHSFNREYLVKILGFDGHRLIEADDARKGIEVAETESLDLVLVDFPLPTMEGAEFLARFREAVPFAGPPVIVLTDPKFKRESQMLADEYGIAAVLAKPCEPELFIRVVRSALAKAAPRLAVASGSPSRYLESAIFRANVDPEPGETLVDWRWPEFDAAAPAGNCADGVERTAHPTGWSDLDQRFVRVNAAFVQLFGYSETELLAMAWSDLVHPEDLAECPSCRTNLDAAEFDESGTQRRYRHRSGQTVAGFARTAAICDSAGRPHAFATQIRDNSKWKLAEVELSETRNRFARVLDSSPVVYCEFALERPSIRISWVTDNVSAMTGFSAAEVRVPGWWSERLARDEADRFSEELSSLAARGSSASDYRLRHRDGTFRWLRVQLHRSKGGTGELCAASWTDVSDRKHFENLYRQSQKLEAVGRLASGVVHDFNNYLTAINGFGEMALGTLRPENPAFGMVREIVAAGNQAAKLIGQLLNSSLNTTSDFGFLDLRTVVAEIRQIAEGILRPDIQLEIRSDHEVGTVPADAGQIHRVLLNLVLNARDAMSRGGRITIDVRNANLEVSLPAIPAGKYVLLAVGDTGCGMDEATKEHLFEPFYTTKGRAGTGLGLAAVQEIVRQIGGHIAFESEAGLGTTMNVYLPRIQEQEIGVPYETKTVLIVEDEDGIRNLARYVLTDCGYAVLEAQDGVQAVRIAEAQEGRIDLLIADLNLPKLGGREVAAKAKAAHPGLRVLFVSGYSQDSVEQGGPLPFEASFLSKPFSTAALAEKVRQILG